MLGVHLKVIPKPGTRQKEISQAWSTSICDTHAGNTSKVIPNKENFSIQTHQAGKFSIQGFRIEKFSIRDLRIEKFSNRDLRIEKFSIRDLRIKKFPKDVVKLFSCL